MLLRAGPLAVIAGLCWACDTVSPPASPDTVASPQTINYNTSVYAGAPSAARATVVSPTDANRIAVLPSSKADQPTEVLGIVDVHEPMVSEEAAVARLREKAAALGADAVLGVEFHHGEAAGEAVHLSGLAVRYLTPARSEW
jgi:hypothetical protein